MNGSCMDQTEFSSNPRQLFRQRRVLDTLRIYLELSDDLLVDMHSNDLLTDDELDTLRRLSWPNNRNELLQVMIRMQWTEESFQEFCDILRRTPTSEFNRMLADKLVDATAELPNAAAHGRPSTAPGGMALSSSQWDDYDESVSIQRPPTTSLDLLLETMPPRDRCAVQTMIRDRDECIAKLTKQMKQLENKLLGKEHALEDARIKNSLTERQLGDWLATLTLPSDAESVASDGETTLKSGLDEVATIIDRQSGRIAQLSADNGELREQLSAVERQAAEQCESLSARLQQTTADAEVARRDKEKLADELEMTRRLLDRPRRSIAAANDRRSSGDSTDDQADAKRSGTKTKPKKTAMKDSHPGESDYQCRKASKPWLRQRKLSSDVTRSGRKDSDTTKPRVRRDSTVDDWKRTDRTSATPTSSRLVVRRASIAAVPATVQHRTAALKPKAYEH